MRGDRFTKRKITLRIAVTQNFARRVSMHACRDARPNLERKFIDRRQPVLKRLEFCNRPPANTLNVFLRNFFAEGRQPKRRGHLFLLRLIYSFGLEQIVWKFGGHKGSRAAFAVEIAFGEKLFIGVQHRDTRDAQFPRQRARCGKAFPRAEFATQDRHPNRLVNLPVQRPVCTPAIEHYEHALFSRHGVRLTSKWSYWKYQKWLLC